MILSKIERAIERMRRQPQNVRFRDLCWVCERFFGLPRQKGTSHRIYRIPVPGDPRVNIQNDNGKAKAYQVRQVLAVIEKLENCDEQEE
jgi:hypothetical protein